MNNTDAVTTLRIQFQAGSRAITVTRTKYFSYAGSVIVVGITAIAVRATRDWLQREKGRGWSVHISWRIFYAPAPCERRTANNTMINTETAFLLCLEIYRLRCYREKKATRGKLVSFSFSAAANGLVLLSPLLACRSCKR